MNTGGCSVGCTDGLIYNVAATNMTVVFISDIVIGTVTGERHVKRTIGTSWMYLENYRRDDKCYETE